MPRSARMGRHFQLKSSAGDTLHTLRLHTQMNDHSSQVSSPKSVESGSNSKFKTLKKKIRNKFRLSRAEDVKTIAQAVETLRRSGELMSLPNDDSDQLKNEFKELRETLESIVNQNQVLAEVVKSVDSCCPDPFNEPEKFTVYFAQKSLNNRSLSDEFEADLPIAAEMVSPVEPVIKNNSVEVENALLRLQNLRMEEQRGFATERENYETRLGQLGLLQQEIEILRKQNSDHELQLDFLKSQNSSPESDSVIDNLKAELATLCHEHASEMTKKDDTINEKASELEAVTSKFNQLNVQHESEMAALVSKVEELTSQNASKDAELKEITRTVQDLEHELKAEKQPAEPAENLDSELVDELRRSNCNLQNRLDEALEQLKALQGNSENSEEKELEFRELSEENARLKIDFNDLKQELKELKTELADIEKEPISSISLEEEQKTSNEVDESAFKYVYLSNLVLKFMQFPEQRPELSNIILTTLQSDQAHFQKAMGQK